MSAHGHAPGGCEGNAVMVASFHFRMLRFCQSSMRLLAQKEVPVAQQPHLVGLPSGRQMHLALRQRHTRRHMKVHGGPPLHMPGSDVGDATCA
jgi:hypothetical protein